MIVASRKEHDRAGPRRLDDHTSVGGDSRAPREHAAVERLEVSEGGIGTGDRHHRLPWFGLIPVAQRPHLEVGPRVSFREAQLENPDRLIGAGDPSVPFLKHLHRDHGRAIFRGEHFAVIPEVGGRRRRPFPRQESWRRGRGHVRVSMRAPSRTTAVARRKGTVSAANLESSGAGGGEDEREFF